MKDTESLYEALRRMKSEEGITARNALVWHVMRKTLDKETRAIAERLSDTLKEDAKKLGARAPQGGPIAVAEVLAQIGMLMNEEEEE
jgi:hypothetical protein